MKYISCILFLIFSPLSGCSSIEDNVLLENKVSLFVEKTTKSKKEEKIAFKELELMGAEAVPYIVGHLRDMRPLAERSITFDNSYPDSFEAVRHYSPETVHDALAAILNQITKQHFVFVYNGATFQERAKNIEQWVEWCKRSYPKQILACNNEK